MCGQTAKELKGVFAGFFHNILSRRPTPGSPQEQAITWLVMKDKRPLELQCPDSNNIFKLTERFIMAVFYFSLGGEYWNNCGKNGRCADTLFKDPHLSQSDYCNWYGVDCIFDIQISELMVKEINLGESLESFYCKNLVFLTKSNFHYLTLYMKLSIGIRQLQSNWNTTKRNWRFISTRESESTKK